MDTAVAQPCDDPAAVLFSDKPGKHDFSAQLPEYARDIAALSARLNDDICRALDLRGLETIDEQDPIDR
jgi:hypothetical protein